MHRLFLRNTNLNAVKPFSSRISSIFSSGNNKELVHQLEHILGFKPTHLIYYETALIHSSKSEDTRQNNERLEFLGDAILGAIIAEYLFKKYPTQDEGFLTELRSRIVRRETMNNVAVRMGLNKLVLYNQQDKTLSRSHIFGNALEALIGAIYLDKGFAKTRTFILKEFIKAYINIDDLEVKDTNYKNKLLNWAQKQGKQVSFETLEEKMEGTRRLFSIGVLLDNELIAAGTGYNKKDAGQVAAENALATLSIAKNNQDN
jgi:ribonuclease-3